MLGLCAKTVVLKVECALELPRRLVKAQFSGSHLQGCNSGSLRQGPRICISNHLPINVPGPETMLAEPRIYLFRLWTIPIGQMKIAVYSQNRIKDIYLNPSALGSSSKARIPVAQCWPSVYLSRCNKIRRPAFAFISVKYLGESIKIASNISPKISFLFFAS